MNRWYQNSRCLYGSLVLLVIFLVMLVAMLSACISPTEASHSGLRLPFVGGPFTITNGPNEGRHRGRSAEAIDFVLTSDGRDVNPAGSGTVIWAKTDSGCDTSKAPNYGFGNLVVIQHGRVFSYYAHLSEILVSERATVDTSKVIGKQVAQVVRGALICISRREQE
jgi:Peptidase family M23